MARKSGSTIAQDELYSPGERDFSRPSLDDARLVDLDDDQESPFLRGQKRVSVRRSTIPKKTANRLKWVLAAGFVLTLFGLAGAAVYRYGAHSWRFRIDSSDNLEITGTRNVTRAQIMQVMGADLGRNIFFVPLAQRQAQLEQIPWVESASVMRFLPNRIKIEVQERTPVAFARMGSHIMLLDATGVLMDLPAAQRRRFSFPVVVGMNPAEPLSTRLPRMRAYNQLIHDLDAGGAHYSADLSEVDVTDPDDVRISVTDPAGDVMVYLGSADFLERYKIYLNHIREWHQQFDKIDSVILRYPGQIIVNPGSKAPEIATAPPQTAATGNKSKPSPGIARKQGH
jgi:cell division protein FtsQ